MSNCTDQDTTFLSLVNAEIKRVRKISVTLISYSPLPTVYRRSFRVKLVTIFMYYALHLIVLIAIQQFCN